MFVKRKKYHDIVWLPKPLPSTAERVLYYVTTLWFGCGNFVEVREQSWSCLQETSVPPSVTLWLHNSITLLSPLLQMDNYGHSGFVTWMQSKSRFEDSLHNSLTLQLGKGWSGSGQLILANEKQLDVYQFTANPNCSVVLQHLKSLKSMRLKHNIL